MKKQKKVRRVVLGVGYPWYVGLRQAQYDSVQLLVKPVAQSILLRGGETTIPLKYSGTGNWNKVRLVLEVLE